MSKNFYDLRDHDLVTVFDILEKAHKDIHKELKSVLYPYLNVGEIPPEIVQRPWYEFDLYKGMWEVIPLYCAKKIHGINYPYFPKTLKAIDEISKEYGEVLVAGFSMLGPGATIYEHDGIDDGANETIRVHLGVDVPNGCYIRVGEPEVDAQYMTWKEGECIAFNDAKLHTACNLSSKLRTVLLVDIVKGKGKTFTPKLREEMTQHYLNIGYL